MDGGFISQEYEVPEAGFGSLPESVHTKQLAIISCVKEKSEALQLVSAIGKNYLFALSIIYGEIQSCQIVHID